MTFSAAARRQAGVLVQLAADGGFGRHVTGLVAQARENPARVVEVLGVLAAAVAGGDPVRPAGKLPAAMPLPVDLSVPPLTRYLRRAHAAYSGGSRLPWVVEGEREYQRIKKREQRVRDRERSAALRRSGKVPPVEDLRWLLETDSPEAVAQRFGVSPDAIDRALRRSA
ncbi:hypothetical protein F9C11_21590 [Amycolatopsis sp. VS8301801F10]|uniref:hypothetical protein n=1 Tax=Amycolatopsis sp. VS8301801F10 TaxID=2652442 RepID=UPI0038FCFE83